MACPAEIPNCGNAQWVISSMVLEAGVGVNNQI